MNHKGSRRTLGMAGLLTTLSLCLVLASAARCAGGPGTTASAGSNAALTNSGGIDPGELTPDPIMIPPKLSGLPSAGNNPSTEPKASMTASNTQFALNMYGQIKGQSGNLFFSPYSIGTALAMADEGARGQTAAEIENVAGLPADAAQRRSNAQSMQTRLNPRDASFELSVANAFWTRKDVKLLPAYTQALTKYYDSEANSIDIAGDPEAARQTINAWAENKTRGRIKDLFPKNAINADTSLVLTNAIYFKGRWQTPFEDYMTSDQPFRAPGGELSVSTMQQSGESYSYAETDELQALELPYEGGQLSMLILLPKGDELAPLEATLSEGQISSLRASMKTEEVDVALPKFTFSSDFVLNDQLAALGMPSAFEFGKADFSGMDGTQNFYIGIVVHKAFVEVSEEGTEAAAATGIAMQEGAAYHPSHAKTFKADHPFLFFILERESGAVLFIGRVENPKG